MNEWILNHEFAYVAVKVLAVLGCFTLIGLIGLLSIDYSARGGGR